MRYILLAIPFLFISSLKAQSSDPGIGDTIHAIHYSIHLTDVNTSDKTIAGFTEVELTPRVNDLDHLPLELKSLTVDSAFIGQTSATFIHQDEVVRIDLDAPVNENDTLSVTVYYHGHPFHEAWGGFHFSGDYAFNLGVGFVSIPHNLGKAWFLCVDDFTDRATYDLYVTVDSAKKVTGDGLLQEVIDNGNGTKTWHWYESHPIPTYLASVAVGDYALYEDEFDGMEDTVPINIYTKPADTGKVEGSFVNLKSILWFFEEKFGPYPFEKVGYTGTAIGAMEHASNIFYPHFAINGNTTYESLYTHELSHMWFGDKVTCSSAEDMWLNEGWASFCEVYYLEGIYSHQNFLKAMRHKHREMLRKTHIVDGGYFALNALPQNITYGSHAYEKGATVTNTLRGYLGDSLFFSAIKAYLNHFAFQSVSSEDMRDFLSDTTGIDMNGFFDAWVFTPGTPHFSIDSTLATPEGDGYKVDIWLKQKYKGADFLADDNVLDITFADDHFNLITDTVHFSGKTGHSVKQISFSPKAVFLDLFERINDATTDNFHFFVQPGEYDFPDTYFKLIIQQLSDSAMIRVTHHWVAPDSLKTPVEGLRLSPYRYWKIEGVIPESMDAIGRFYYDNMGYLDDGLILSDNDSVIILYRENTRNDWQEIPQTRLGTWDIGYIFVDHLQAGEYSLAVWDKHVVGIPEASLQEPVKIFPNPTNHLVNFAFAEKGRYNIIMNDTQGVVLAQFPINGKSKSWKVHNRDAFKGVVFVSIYKGGKLLTVKKLLFIKP